MTRNLFSRVVKLENRRRTDDQVLLIWLRPEQSIDEAVLTANMNGQFGSGDLVMCVEWLGDGPIPAARWIKRRNERLSIQETEYVEAMIAKKIASIEQANDTVDDVTLSRPLPRNLAEVPTIDLMHCVLGVAT